jgi:hypothetical protein
MKEIKKEVVTEEVVAYELTKEELEEIKRKERNRGRTEGIHDFGEYIWFCRENSAYVFNYGWTMRFVKDLLLFFNGEQDYIENKYNYSFKEFLKRYKET